MQTNEKTGSATVEKIAISFQKTQMIEDLYKGGPVGNDLKRRMRASIESLISEQDGRDFAQNNYWAISQHVINAALVMYCPDYCKHLLTEGQVKVVREKYPVQFEMVKAVIESVN